MAVQSKATLKTYFVTGAKPTETQFSNLIDSFVHVQGEAALDGNFKFTNVNEHEIGQGTAALVLQPASINSLTSDAIFLRNSNDDGMLGFIPSTSGWGFDAMNGTEFRFFASGSNGKVYIGQNEVVALPLLTTVSNSAVYTERRLITEFKLSSAPAIGDYIAILQLNGFSNNPKLLCQVAKSASTSSTITIFGLFGMYMQAAVYRSVNNDVNYTLHSGYSTIDAGRNTVNNTDVRIGELWNHKPVYMRAISISVGSAFPTAQIATNVENAWIDHSNSFFINASGGDIYSLARPFGLSTSGLTCCWLTFGAGNTLSITGSSQGGSGTAKVLVKYTKTTDTAFVAP